MKAPDSLTKKFSPGAMKSTMKKGNPFKAAGNAVKAMGGIFGKKSAAPGKPKSGGVFGGLMKNKLAAKAKAPAPAASA